MCVSQPRLPAGPESPFCLLCGQYFLNGDRKSNGTIRFILKPIFALPKRTRIKIVNGAAIIEDVRIVIGKN